MGNHSYISFNLNNRQFPKANINIDAWNQKVNELKILVIKTSFIMRIL